MNRTIFLTALFVAAAVTAGAQQTSQSNPYQGTSNPPPNDTIVSDTPQQPKPPAGHPVTVPQPAQTPTQPPAQPPAQPPIDQYAEPVPPQSASAPPPGNQAIPHGDGTADGIVEVEPTTSENTPQPQAGSPALMSRLYASDPDGDIVHPQPLPPGELGDGTVIRVQLLQGLSTAYSESGDHFRSRVTNDVLQDGTVLIPAGSEIDGRVAYASSGHFAGHGWMNLVPEMVVLPDGSRDEMFAEVSGAPGAKARIGAEGTIEPASRLRRDSIEYGGAVGAGAATGAIIAGPAGALAGTLIGAGVITAHLMISHPQATLDQGTTLLFTLTEPLRLVPAAPNGK